MIEQENLNNMAMMIAGVPFVQVQHPEHRAIIVKLALQADIADSCRELVSTADAAVDNLNGITESVKKLSEDVGSIEEEMRDVGKWFRLSKLWEGS